VNIAEHIPVRVARKIIGEFTQVCFIYNFSKHRLTVANNCMVPSSGVELTRARTLVITAKALVI